MTAGKQGALSQADLMAIWAAAVDESYSQPLIAAGDGNGLEIYSQAAAQWARVSSAIDTTTQAMYIRPSSAQTAPPASGAQLATVELTLVRGAAYVDRALVLKAGTTYAEEQATDAGVNGGVLVRTGRRYALALDAVFLPGEQGPIDVPATAERPGQGYNNPGPGYIQVLSTPAAGYAGVLATVTVAAGVFASTPTAQPVPAQVVTLTAENVPDMFVPDHVGRYVLFTAGANAGTIARVTGFVPSQPFATPPAGTGVTLDIVASIESATVVGVFAMGELVQVLSGATVVGYATPIAARLAPGTGHTRIALSMLAGALVVGDTLLGVVSGATATIDIDSQRPTIAAEAPSGGHGGASWRVLDWGADLGVTVTNAAAPQGGTSDMLDLLGSERDVGRSANELDDSYGERVAQVADVVSPNAILRACNRALRGLPFCYREAGSTYLPGFFYDGDGSLPSATPHASTNDYWDSNAYVWSGVYTGTFAFQERVEYRSADGSFKADGYYGSVQTGAVGAAPAVAPAIDGSHFLLVSKNNVPPTAVVAGDVIVGLVTGATFAPAAVTALATPAVANRFHVWLDYASFRGFFMVGVGAQDFGDFGFAYDDHPRGFYDLGGTNAQTDFYDGFAAGDADLYKNVYGNVENVREGGVLWTLYLEDGTCV